jgi:hypothetical protein
MRARDVVLPPEEVLIRLFFRSSNKDWDKLRIGDLLRTKKDFCGISTYRISLLSESEIYNKFKSQVMGMFQITVEQLTKEGFQYICLDNDPAHVSIACSLCDLRNVCCNDPCSRKDNSACIMHREPGIELYHLMDRFERRHKAEQRTTSWIPKTQTTECVYNAANGTVIG